MINIYSVKSSSKKFLSANFTVGEFKCRDGSDRVLIDTELVGILQMIRNKFNKSVNINSAYRTPSYNAKIGGVSNSQHICGTAADICIYGIEPLKIAEYAEYIMKGFGGIGLYKTFVHIDVRKKRARWKNYGKEIAVKEFGGYMERKNLITANDIIWELSQRIKITDVNAAVRALEKAECENSSLYWILRKIANS